MADNRIEELKKMLGGNKEISRQRFEELRDTFKPTTSDDYDRFNKLYNTFIMGLEKSKRPDTPAKQRIAKENAYEIYKYAQKWGVHPALAWSIAAQESALGTHKLSVDEATGIVKGGLKNIFQFKSEAAYQEVKKLLGLKYKNLKEFQEKGLRSEHIEAGLVYLKALEHNVAINKAKKDIMQQYGLKSEKVNSWDEHIQNIFYHELLPKYKEQVSEELATGKLDKETKYLLLGGYNEGIGGVGKKYLEAIKTGTDFSKLLNYTTPGSDNVSPAQYADEVFSRVNNFKLIMEKYDKLHSPKSVLRQQNIPTQQQTIANYTADKLNEKLDIKKKLAMELMNKTQSTKTKYPDSLLKRFNLNF